MSAQDEGTYPGGFPAILRQMEARRDPLTFGRGEALPALNIELSPLLAGIVQDPATDPAEQAPVRSSHGRKRRDIRAELAGKSELCALNGLLIAHLRKRGQPAHAAALFHRIWAEQADHLLDHLDLRWLVSSITTFGDHGLTRTQRQVGQAMTVLFGTMKLYETERLYSGLAPGRPFTLSGKSPEPLPMQMDAYSLAYGGLDVNMLGRLWQDADGDDVIRPLAHHLLGQLVADERTVFRRLTMMRNRLERRRRNKAEARAERAAPPAPRTGLDADRPRWGVVSTVKAPLEQILDFAAWHLDLGAHRLFLYLDDPDPDSLAALKAHPRIRVTACDAAYWARKPQRPDKHQARQSVNARDACNRKTQVDWLAHIDVDELLAPETPLPAQLAALPPDCMVARLRPVEALAPGTGTAPGETAFKAFHLDQEARQAASERCFPRWGRYLSGGFLSHVAGKLIFRTGLDRPQIRIHNVQVGDMSNPGERPLPGTELLHMHARSWQDWQRTYRFRLDRGSYRAELKPQVRTGEALPNLHDLFARIEADQGLQGLRAFYDEVCTASDALCARLETEGLLRRHALDLAAKRARHFPGH